MKLNQLITDRGEDLLNDPLALAGISSIKDLYNSVYNKLLTLPKETTIYPGHHYGFSKTITINENIRLFDFFSCNSFEEFKLVMQNFEKNR